MVGGAIVVPLPT